MTAPASADQAVVVVAVGGNALVRRGQVVDVPNQRAAVARASGALAEMAAGHRLVVTHGNGPQVGLLAEQAEAQVGRHPTPLDVLDAESEGLIGYLLVEALDRELGSGHSVALLTRVVVDPDDPALTVPTKPVGPVFPADRGPALATARGWTLVPDRGGVRRAVGSPRPLEVVELEAIRALLVAGHTVVAAGGGGIPVSPSGVGVEAVVDKDRTAGLLARRLGAERLLILTDVDAVYVDWGGADAHPLGEVTVSALASLDLPAGSMGPKVEAACEFVAETGKMAAIGDLADAAAVLAGRVGTRIVPG